MIRKPLSCTEWTAWYAAKRANRPVSARTGADLPETRRPAARALRAHRCAIADPRLRAADDPEAGGSEPGACRSRSSSGVLVWVRCTPLRESHDPVRLVLERRSRVAGVLQDEE